MSGLQVHEPIAVVTYSDETARLTHGEIVQVEPLVVQLHESDLSGFPEGCQAMLIVRTKTPLWRGRSTIGSSSLKGENVNVQFDEVAWELEDRRKYPRFPVEVGVNLKLVHEQEDSLSFTETTGTTIDLSLGGAAVRTNGNVPVGTLVEFKWTQVDGKSFRCLAIVLHQKEDSQIVGIEFVNYIGEAKSTLEQMLAEAA